jgi:hypothetical protein
MRRYRPTRFYVLVDLPQRTVRAECRVWPKRNASRAGADSPRFMEPGFPGGIDQLRLTENWIDVTSEFGPRTLSVIKAVVRDAAFSIPRPARVQPPFPAPASLDRYGERSDDSDQFPLIADSSEEEIFAGTPRRC